MIKLIATDMDGTLLNTKDEINPEFFKIFKKLKEKEIIFAVASGRQYFNLVKKFKSIKDDVMFVAENGTFVVYKGEEVVVNSLDKEIALELINIGKNIKEAYVVVCGKNSAYIDSSEERLIREVERYYEKYTIVDDLTAIEDDILKVTICDFLVSEKNSFIYYREYKDKLQISISGKIWLDITAKGINKGVAMKKVQELLEISYKETMVFGDYLNDLEMMDSAYYSFAMENAHKDLKKVARFRAKSNDDNGVVDKIKEIINL